MGSHLQPALLALMAVVAAGRMWAACPPVSTVQVPAGPYGFFGLGDENRCAVDSGPGGPQRPGALFMYGVFGSEAANPPLYLTAKAGAPGEALAQLPADAAPLGFFPNGLTPGRVQIAAVPRATSFPALNGDTAYLLGQRPGVGTYYYLGRWNYRSVVTPAYPPPAATGCITGAGAVRLGNSSAYVHTERQAPPGANLDQVNPSPVLFSAGITPNSAPAEWNADRTLAPPRVHSWASAMTWASNDPNHKYWNGSTELRPLQGPVYADPLIFFYSSQPPSKNCRTPDGVCYLAPGYLTGQSQTNPAPPPSNLDLYSAGFHLGTSTPATNFGNLFSGGTVPTVYNYGGRAVHGNAAPARVGLDGMGIWRETLVVFPSNNATPWAPEYLPANPQTVHQGDWDAGFRMTAPAGNRWLQMDVAQGSPYAQFTSYGNQAITIGAVYAPGYAPNGVAGGLAKPAEVTVRGTTLRYQLIYQQVNGVVSPTEAFASAPENPGRINWVSFAVFWDPAQVNADKLAEATNPGDGMTYYSLPAGSAEPVHVVVAALPNQMQNNADARACAAGVAASCFDPVAAGAWAQALAPYAFNYFQGKSAVRFFVGQGRDGAPRAAETVQVIYEPNLAAKGPSEPGSVFLLQPHQYSDRFRDGRNRMPLDLPAGWQGGSPFLSFDGANGMRRRENKYWIVRGHLEAFAAEEVSLTYVMPPMLPTLPASVLRDEPARKGAAGGAFSGVDFLPSELAYALGAASAYPSIIAGPPARSNLANYTLSPGIGQMNEPYSAGLGVYHSARLLHVLAGLEQPARAPEWMPDNLPWIGKQEMLGGLYGEITQFFSTWFSPQMCPVESREDRPALRSYVYAYYDQGTAARPGSRRVVLYPSGTKLNPARPQSYKPYAEGVNDAFGLGTSLSDGSYAYGYFINAAALFTMALRADAIPGLTPEQKAWWDESHFGPAVDLLIRDVAYADSAGAAKIPWWVSQAQIPAPRLDGIDLWTGIAFADAFVPGASYGKQHNSAQETQITWAGIYLWGKATGRPALANLGAFLYTLGSYSNDAYFTGSLGLATPERGSEEDEFSSDYSTAGSFLPRATRDLAESGIAAAGKTWNYSPQQRLTQGERRSAGSPCLATEGCRGASPAQLQPATPSQLSAGAPHQPFLTAGVYQGRQWYQGEDGQSPLNTLFNIVYPFEPMTLSVLRNTEYLREAAQASLTQGGTPFYSAAYAGTTNLLFGALQMEQSASGMYLRPNTLEAPPGVVGPPPMFDNGDLGCQAGILLEAKARALPPLRWFWSLATGGTRRGDVPWNNLTLPGLPGECIENPNSGSPVKLVQYFSRPEAVAATVVDFFVFEKLGLPDFDISCAAVNPPIEISAPLCMVFTKHGVRSAVVYNPNSQPVEVQFRRVGDGESIGDPILARPWMETVGRVK